MTANSKHSALTDIGTIMKNESILRLAMSNAVAVVLTVSSITFASLAMTGAASAQSSTDACPGEPGTVYTYAFDGIPTASDELLPSVRRSISILGLRANTHDCGLRITCVSTSTDREAKRAMDRQCSVTRGALFAYERRSNVRERLREELDLVKMTTPGDGFTAGRVYVSLIAK